jgi:peptidoglycan/xylan/chitin deacetylase (PgdA/CDA1 family)
MKNKHSKNWISIVSLLIFFAGCSPQLVPTAISTPESLITLKVQPSPTNNSSNSVITDFPQKCNVVALTFDDGPMEPFTSEILDILDKAKIKATFFLMGKNLEKDSITAKRIQVDGHEIGNHSYTHPIMALLSSADIEKDIKMTESAIFYITGFRTTLFRPPYGRYSPLLFPVTDKLGYKVITWSVDPVNWNNPNPSINTDIILKNTKPGSIILLHDGSENDPPTPFNPADTVSKLPTIIEDLKTRGFCFSTVSQLLSKEACQKCQ